jgi:hypothetical protein
MKANTVRMEKFGISEAKVAKKYWPLTVSSETDWRKGTLKQLNLIAHCYFLEWSELIFYDDQKTYGMCYEGTASAIRIMIVKMKSVLCF